MSRHKVLVSHQGCDTEPLSNGSVPRVVDSHCLAHLRFIPPEVDVYELGRSARLSHDRPTPQGPPPTS